MFNQLGRKKSFYEILDISTTATIEEIKESYARAKSTYSEENPALYGMVSGGEREDTLNLIEEAFKVLSNPEAKQQYDNSLDNNNGHLDKGRGSSEFTLNKNETNNIARAKQNSFEEQSIKKLIETNKYQLSYEVNEEFEKQIRESTQFSGEFLQSIREYKQVSIEKMAEMTRISKNNIRNIELENMGPLPAIVYVRGFVYQYAKCLKLNPELVASSYMHQLKKKQEN